MTNSKTNRQDEDPLSEEGYALMAAAFELHNEVGGGLLVEIYPDGIRGRKPLINADEH